MKENTDFWEVSGPKYRSRGSSEATKFIGIHRKVVRNKIITNINNQNIEQYGLKNSQKEKKINGSIMQYNLTGELKMQI